MLTKNCKERLKLLREKLRSRNTKIPEQKELYITEEIKENSLEGKLLMTMTNKENSRKILKR
jgi:hypothetical protein